MSVGWAFSKFLATTSFTVLSNGRQDDFGARLAAHIAYNPARLELLQKKVNELGLPPVSSPLTEQWLAANMFSLLGRISQADWSELFDVPAAASLGTASGPTLSSITRANFIDGRKALREVARERAAETGASVIVMGHTHQPDEVQFDDCRYFNPGSWTRYLELDPGTKVTLEDLRREEDYPYELNVVRVEAVQGILESSMYAVDSSPKRC